MGEIKAAEDLRAGECADCARTNAQKDWAWARFFEAAGSSAQPRGERMDPAQAWREASRAVAARANSEAGTRRLNNERPASFAQVESEGYGWALRGLAQAAERAETGGKPLDCSPCEPAIPAGLLGESNVSGPPADAQWARLCWEEALLDDTALRTLFGPQSHGAQRGLAGQSLGRLAGLWAKRPQTQNLARGLLSKIALEAREQQAVVGLYAGVCEENRNAVRFFLDEWGDLGWDWRTKAWADGRCLSPFSCVASLPMAQWMQSQGMDPKWKDPRTGRGALWSASYWDCIKVLLELGADPNERDAQGVTPFMAFASLDWVAEGAEVADPQGLLAGLEKTARGYLAAGADASAKDQQGRDALARLRGNAGAINARLRGPLSESQDAHRARLVFAQRWGARLEGLIVRQAMPKTSRGQSGASDRGESGPGLSRSEREKSQQEKIRAIQESPRESRAQQSSQQTVAESGALRL